LEFQGYSTQPIIIRTESRPGYLACGTLGTIIALSKFPLYGLVALNMCPISVTRTDGRADNVIEADGNVPKVKVAIVGAGASGLQCCNTLMNEYGLAASDILLLEARNRIGGRIHTTIEHGSNVVDGSKYRFPLDHGAAWVHGIGLDWGATTRHSPLDAEGKPAVNPMMELLFQETAAASPIATVYDRHLNPVFTGNPWMRPREVLHNKGQLSLFVAGRQLDESVEEDRAVVSLALQRHFYSMTDAHRIGLELFNERRGLETATTSLGETIDKVLESRDFYRQQLESVRSEDAASVRALAPFYLLLVECWYGCSVKDIQLCEFTKDEETITDQEDAEYSCQGDFSGPHCTLRHGMVSVLQPLLANGVRERIQLEQEVTKIGCREVNGETIIALETAAGLKVHAEACVVTMPAGCVKEAVSNGVFETTLSDDKLKAISYLKMGNYKKVFLTFDHIFWPAKPAFVGMVRRLDGDARHVGDNRLGNNLLFDNLWAINGMPSIEAVLFGEAGAWSAHKSESEIRDAILEFMADAMGLCINDLQRYCQNCHVTRWEEDPFSRGAYSSLALGALESHVEELRKPEWEGRLAFAGEATISEFEGSVYAALISGVAAAKNINAHFSETAHNVN
jgi:monoamine oxidase